MENAWNFDKNWNKHAKQSWVLGLSARPYLNVAVDTIGHETDFTLEEKKTEKMKEKLLKTVDNIMWPSVLMSLDVLVRGGGPRTP